MTSSHRRRIPPSIAPAHLGAESADTHPAPVFFEENMVAYNEIRCDTAGEGAAVGLLALMTGISEEYWCAGWMDGLEFALWCAPAGKQYGRGEITERQASLLRLLSAECDGWWCWKGVSPAFVSTKEWGEQLAQSHP